MQAEKIILCMASLSILGSFVFGGVIEADKKGVVTYADGQVRRKAIDIENWENAPVNTEVLTGDKVRTYRESRAELDLAQLDVVRLAPRTIIDVIKLYEETKEKKVETEIYLESGEIWASVHEIEVDTKFDISAPITAAAITGTHLRMRVEEDSSTQLKVYTGEVRITNAPQRNDLTPRSLVPQEIEGPREIPGPYEVTVEEWIYIVASMQQITIDRNGRVVSLGQFTFEDEDERNEWVIWNQRRDQIRSERIEGF
ncbi:FecR domain-containing protein [bacterium]|nr:FecR domain-containing protein [bacterium]RQV93291.1 MAG: hypothetical protein EH221_09985 [bacterium]